VTDPDWKQIREIVLHRDGRCLNCGAVIGLDPHHIKSRGSGGTDDEENLITLCMWCHDQAHRGFVVVNRRMTRTKAEKNKIPVYWGDRLRLYFRGLVEQQYKKEA